MSLILHITIALLSLVMSTVLFARPSQTLLRVSYSLVGLTVASGTYVAWVTHARILETCLTGLLYLGAVSVGIFSARHRLATETTNSKR
jgi:hypothetical protein